MVARRRRAATIAVDKHHPRSALRSIRSLASQARRGNRLNPLGCHVSTRVCANTDTLRQALLTPRPRGNAGLERRGVIQQLSYHLISAWAQQQSFGSATVARFWSEGAGAAEDKVRSFERRGHGRERKRERRGEEKGSGQGDTRRDERTGHDGERGGSGGGHPIRRRCLVGCWVLLVTPKNYCTAVCASAFRVVRQRQKAGRRVDAMYIALLADAELLETLYSPQSSSDPLLPHITLTTEDPRNVSR